MEYKENRLAAHFRVALIQRFSPFVFDDHTTRVRDDRQPRALRLYTGFMGYIGGRYR